MEESRSKIARNTSGIIETKMETLYWKLNTIKDSELDTVFSNYLNSKQNI